MVCSARSPSGESVPPAQIRSGGLATSGGTGIGPLGGPGMFRAGVGDSPPSRRASVERLMVGMSDRPVKARDGVAEDGVGRP